MGYRTTTGVRIRKAALERIRWLSHQQSEDIVDLLDLAAVLLERELSKSAADREAVPEKSTVVQLPLSVEVVRSPWGASEFVRARASESVRGKAREEKND